jgi:small conductance mechanosensitive channel
VEKIFERIDFDQISLVTVGQSILKIIAVLIAVRLTIRFLNLLIDKFFQKQIDGKVKMDSKKVITVNTLAKSVVTYTIYFIGFTMIIAILGIPPTSILATAGIGGLAIGFGAQNLVRDVITGFFILLEDQYAVGDYITLDKYSGIVEEIGIRTTKVRDFNGDLHIIPNGNVSNVTNHCRGNMRIMFDIGIAYEEDIDNAIGVIESFLENYKKQEPNIVDGPKVLGVSDLADSSVKLRIWATSKPMEQWRIERELRKGIKRALDEAGIEIPYPKRVILNK